MTETAARLRAALVDRYAVERELGQGGMATVFLAHDVRHDRPVAIKVLHPELAAALGGERFLSEIKTTAKLQHPHILALLDSGVADGLLYYVMPYVAGETLRARLERERQLPIADALRIAREVADALDVAHRQGIVHRDIKPENILLQNEHAQVADFGIALAVQQAGGARLTQTGLSLGTPQYMAPEQAMGEKSVDHRADIYALGAVTYEMLAGEPPFTGPTIQAIVARVITESPRPLIGLRKSVPAPVENAVLHALEKLPADRFRSAGEFAAALGDTSTAPSVRHPSAAPRPRAVGIAAVAAGAALLALGWLLGRLANSGRTTERATPMMFTLPAELARNSPGRLIAVAHDGSQFVFVQDLASGGASQLVLRRLDSPDAVALAGTRNARNPFFSSDGEWVAFEQDGKLRKVSLSGGMPATIANVAAGFQLQGAWGPDGDIVYTTLGRAHRVSGDGGAVTTISLPDKVFYSSPILLPGGHHAVFTRSSSILGGADRETVVHSLETGQEIALLFRGTAVEYVESGYLTFVNPDGVLMAAPFDAKQGRLTGRGETLAAGLSYLGRSVPAGVSRNGTVVYAQEQWNDRELVLVGVNAQTTVLPVGKRAFRGPRFSPDGRRIAVDVEPGGDLLGDIFVFDRSSGTFAQVTFEGTGVFPEWAADGKTLYYSAEKAPEVRSIFRVPYDRSAAPELVVKASAPVFEIAATPRGDTILYRLNADSTGRDIHLMANGVSVPFFVGPANHRSATISPDGRLVLYVSDESGRAEVYVRRLPTPGSVPVSVSGGAEPRWGPGGKDAYYWSGDTLFAVPITASPSPNVGVRLMILTGDYAREAFHSNYDIAPDGRTFVFIRRADGANGSLVTVLVNWLGRHAEAR